MPLIPALSGVRDPAWRDVLLQLLDTIEAAGPLTPPLAQLVANLRALDAQTLDAQADAIFAQRFAEVDPAGAPFIIAALQVVWTDLAADIDKSQVPYLDTPGLCPVCGSHPVASVVRDRRRVRELSITCNAACARPSGTWSARSARIAIRPKASRITRSAPPTPTRQTKDSRVEERATEGRIV